MMKVLVCLLSLCSFIGKAQEIQGYIDYERVVKVLPEYPMIMHNYDSLTKVLDDSLKTMRDDFDRYLQKQHNIQVDTLNKWLYKRQKFEEYILGKLEEYHDQLKNDLKRVFIKNIEKFCVSYKIQNILLKEAILYCPNCKDYTEEFMTYLKEERG